LQDVTFEVARGQMLGIIGPNGSGKSTLLRLVGGVGRPDTGTVSVNGRLGALLDLGAGFHSELTGRDNILISGVIAGLTRRHVSQRFDQIVDFAELQSFLDNPLRTYSSGMKMRLAFAVATHIDPEILLIDEILSVGDLTFQSKCLERIDQFRQKGCTMLLVSHDLDQIEKFCDAVLWLKRGKVRAYGPPKQVIQAYSEEMSYETRRRTPENSHDDSSDNANGLKLRQNRFGSLDVEILAVRLSDAFGNRVQTISSGEFLSIQIDYRSHIPAQEPVFGVTVSTQDDKVVCEMMLEKNSFTLSGAKQQGTLTLDIERLDLSSGQYFLDVGVYEKNWDYAYDYHWHVYPLSVESPRSFKGILSPPHNWRWSESRADLEN
jgi:lipopolysaccharide transport system ATP-binding protein